LLTGLPVTPPAPSSFHELHYVQISRAISIDTIQRHNLRFAAPCFVQESTGDIATLTGIPA